MLVIIALVITILPVIVGKCSFAGKSQSTRCMEIFQVIIADGVSIERVRAAVERKRKTERIYLDNNSWETKNNNKSNVNDGKNWKILLWQSEKKIENDGTKIECDFWVSISG